MVYDLIVFVNLHVVCIGQFYWN